MVKHCYTVARHTFVVRMSDTEKGISLPSYDPFAAEDDDTCGLLFALTVDDTFYPSVKGELIGEFDCGAAYFGVYRLADGTYQMLVSPPDGQYCGLMQASPDFKEAVIATRGRDSLRTFAVNNALMLMYAFASAGMGTLLVHASVIKNNDRGYLFLGKSGTGKSTHSGLWLKYIEGSELLNDDNPVVRIDDEGATVYGSPWSGKTPCYKNDSARIGAFVQIKQKPENRIVRELPLQAFAVLLPSMSTMKWDKQVYGGVCDSVGRLIEKVPLYALGCRPDKEAAEVCHAEVTK
ncbi:MAG: hypothetical protein IKJ18_09295 [Bacteroidaceae bacterium]|nr:hypothetical protein [Bacteroidaceae bacterium]